MVRSSTAKRIVVLTGNHLCHNPRVVKEAGALARAGFDVTVLGAWFDMKLAQRDRELLAAQPFRFEPVLNVVEKGGALLAPRLRSKAAAAVKQHLGIESRWQLGYAYPALRRRALAFPAELYIAHSEAALAVAAELRRRGGRVGVDMEDWFSEDLLPEARSSRPLRLLHSYERELLTLGAYRSCPSRAMSAALAERYSARAPTVIYNAFPWAERDAFDGVKKDRRGLETCSIHWFSQTLGPGRGLEELLAALALMRSRAEIHLRGNASPAFEAWLRARAPQSWHSRLFIHPLVSNSQLHSRIAEHDIGFAGEQTYCRSRDLTVTNKILSYMLAGLAVVASDTAGQREVAELAPAAISLYRPGDARELARALDDLLSSPAKLSRAKAQALQAAEQRFCWEKQEPILVESVGRALAAA